MKKDKQKKISLKIEKPKTPKPEAVPFSTKSSKAPKLKVAPQLQSPAKEIPLAGEYGCGRGMFSPPPWKKGFEGRPPIYATVKELEEKIDDYFKYEVGEFPIFLRDESTGRFLMNPKTGKPETVKGFGGKTVFKMKYPTVSGLALYLGFCDRRSIYDYRDKPVTKKVDEKLAAAFSHTIKKAIGYIEQIAEGNLMRNEKPIGAIFWLKNHGWKDESIQHQKREVFKVLPPGEKPEGVEDFPEEKDE